MKNTTVYLVRLNEPVREMARLAAREVFPRGQLAPVRTVEEAIHLPGHARQLLIVGDTSEADIGLAAQAANADDLPRWAVVHIGDTPSDLVETVPPGECSVRLLARVFRLAVLHHELLVENLQLRGDLKTVARRFNHDIRTPLGCIDAACALLHELPAAGVEPPHATIAAIRSATAEIDTLLDRVSFVLRASSDPLPVSPLTMEPIVRQTVARFAADAERRGLKIRQPAQWPEVRGVELWLEFIWTNLIQNVLRHSPRSGVIQLGCEAKGAEVRFWIASEGAVPPALRPNLLRPFHLLHEKPSAGLGLSLVERLVSLQGGRCGYESLANDQALFYFTLPAANPSFTGLSQETAARPISLTRGSAP